MAYEADRDADDGNRIPPDEDDVMGSGLIDVGFDRESLSAEWESAWEDAHTDPREALPGLEDILRRLLPAHGYVLGESDPAVAGEEVEVIATYSAVRQVADAVREGEDVDLGDIGQAIEDARELYESLIDR
jgi:hypothetical protein